MNQLLNKPFYVALSVVVCSLTLSCKDTKNETQKQEIKTSQNQDLVYRTYTPKTTDKIISRSEYANKLYGFWLGQCIANYGNSQTKASLGSEPVNVFGQELEGVLEMDGFEWRE